MGSAKSYSSLLKTRIAYENRLSKQRRPSRRQPILRGSRPRLESLEDRTLPAGNLTLTNALLVNSNNQAISAPDKGEMVFIQADWNTQGLASNAAYSVSYSVDGVVLSTGTQTFGAGHSFSESWNWYLGGWFASPGSHSVTVTVDPDNSVAETNESDNTRSFSFTPVTASDFPQKLITPLGGTPFQTWGIVNYVDVNPLNGSFNDFTGNHYTYDAHNGWDITAANFGAMDAGLVEYAAAPGTVAFVQDGNFDRNKATSNAPANYIDIDIGNGWHTIYYHLRSDTILVHVGDTVTTGQILGLAGSSGSSTLVHLHFGLYHNGDLVEPDYDPNTYWVNPLPFQGSLSGVVDSAVTLANATMTTDLNAEERPVSANVFTQAANQQLSVWFNVFSRTNDAVVMKFYQPNGSLYAPLGGSFTTVESRGGYYYGTFNLPAGLTLGTWHVGVEFNGVELARDAFQVTTSGAGAARVTQGSTDVPNGRTTPIDFGTVNPGVAPPQLTFTVANLGSATLNVSSLTLPSGFALVGGFPTSIAVGGSASFTVQMAAASSGTRAGVLSFVTNDPNAPTYSFNIKGLVTGGNAGAIHGQIFDDLNGNTIENGAEVGLVGWTVMLLNPADNSVIATTTTSYNGYYAFLNLPLANYRVRESPPTGWHQSTANPADVTVAANDVLASPFGVALNTVAHFAVSAPATIGAGAPTTITVTALDSTSGTVPGYVGTVHFTSSDPLAVLPPDYTFLAGDSGVHTFNVTLNTAGNQTITAVDVGNSSVTGVSNAIIVVAPIAIQGTQVNDGNVQRSMVQSLTVSFNHAVTLDVGAFSIVLHANSTINGVTGQTSGTLPVLGWSTSDGGLTYVITFSGAGVINNSIADGLYDLRLDHTKTHDAANQQLATDYVFAFYRLYGDFNGDGTVNNADSFQFSRAFNKSIGQAGYLAFFDYNGDGTINNSDNFQFSRRFNTTFKL